MEYSERHHKHKHHHHKHKSVNTLVEPISTLVEPVKSNLDGIPLPDSYIDKCVSNVMYHKVRGDERELVVKSIIKSVLKSQSNKMKTKLNSEQLIAELTKIFSTFKQSEGDIVINQDFVKNICQVACQMIGKSLLDGNAPHVSDYLPQTTKLIDERLQYAISLGDETNPQTELISRTPNDVAFEYILPIVDQYLAELLSGETCRQQLDQLIQSSIKNIVNINIVEPDHPL